MILIASKRENQSIIAFLSSFAESASGPGDPEMLNGSILSVGIPLMARAGYCPEADFRNIDPVTSSVADVFSWLTNIRLAVTIMAKAKAAMSVRVYLGCKSLRAILDDALSAMKFESFRRITGTYVPRGILINIVSLAPGPA